MTALILLFCAADGLVCVHDLTVFAPITTLEKARGATMFVLDLQVNGFLLEASLGCYFSYYN